MTEIPIWLSIVAAAIAAWFGVGYGKRLHERGFSVAARISVSECPLLPIALLLFVLLHVATATLLQDPQIGWSLPLFIEYYLTAAMWLLKIAFVTFAMAAVTAAGFYQQHASRKTLLLLSIGAVITVELLARHSARPKLGPIEAREKDGVIMQTNPSTCAAASAANIVRHFGIKATEADMVARLHTTWAGTSPAQIVYGLRGLGLEARKVQFPDRDLEKVAPPAILLVEVDNEPDAHAVAYMGKTGELYEIWNPSSGRRLLPVTEAQKGWRGRAIEVDRGDRGAG